MMEHTFSKLQCFLNFRKYFGNFCRKYFQIINFRKFPITSFDYLFFDEHTNDGTIAAKKFRPSLSRP
jgi:hypothetical protein